MLHVDRIPSLTIDAVYLSCRRKLYMITPLGVVFCPSFFSLASAGWPARLEYLHILRFFPSTELVSSFCCSYINSPLSFCFVSTELSCVCFLFICSLSASRNQNKMSSKPQCGSDKSGGEAEYNLPLHVAGLCKSFLLSIFCNSLLKP